MTDDNESRLAWLSHALDEALRLGVLQPADLLAHVTPEVLAERLPRELMVKVFASAFSTGKLTPDGILAVAPPQTLVRHVAPSIVWDALRGAAERGQLAAPGSLAKGSTPGRSWLAALLGAGLERGIFGARDVVRHLPPSSWVGEVPREVVAGLLGMGLSQATFDADLILRLLKPQIIGEHVAPHLAWRIVDEGARKAFSLDETPAT